MVRCMQSWCGLERTQTHYVDLKTPFEVCTYRRSSLTTAQTRLISARLESDEVEGVSLWREEILLQCAYYIFLGQITRYRSTNCD